MGDAIRKLSEQLIAEKDSELQSLLSAAFVRLSQEASASKNYAAVNEVCAGMEAVGKQRPVLVNDLRPRVGVENRLPEFIEEALRSESMPPDLIAVLRRTTAVGRGASGGPFLPLHAARRMRPHDRTGQGNGCAGPGAVARNSAHRPVASGLQRRRTFEPTGCRPRCWNCCPRVCPSGTASITILWSGRSPTAPHRTAAARCWSWPRFSIRWFCRKLSMKLA